MTKHRLQLDFSEKALAELDTLRERMELPNRAEVIRQALRLLQWTMNIHAKKGRIIVDIDDRQQEVVFPFWFVSEAETTSHASRQATARRAV